MERKSPSCDVFIIAHHPTAAGVNNLLELKEKDLSKIIKDQGSIDSALKGNPLMRKAIWDNAGNFWELQEIEIPVTKPKEDSKRIWEQRSHSVP
ncbi:MAG: hypothetical protein R3E95_09390 [Thiolinea sp.]